MKATAAVMMDGLGGRGVVGGGGLWTGQEHRGVVVDMVWFDVLQTVASWDCGSVFTVHGFVV